MLVVIGYNVEIDKLFNTPSRDMNRNSNLTMAP
jgi:hypothetical protein